MSYILDALKKSEDERSQQERVQRQSLQNQSSRPGRSISLKLWLALMFVVLACLLFWWFWPSLSNVLYQARLESNSSSQSSAVAQKDKTIQESLSPESPVVASSGGANENIGNSAVAEQYTFESPLPPGNEIKELWQLPADFQARVPALSFSFHVFSDTPENRTIIINDRRLKEGAMVTSKIRLRMITSTGVILFAHGRFFHVDVYEQMYVPEGS